MKTIRFILGILVSIGLLITIVPVIKNIIAVHIGVSAEDIDTVMSGIIWGVVGILLGSLTSVIINRKLKS